MQFSHKKEGNFAICDNMDKPKGYYVKVRQKRQIPYDLNDMWNKKNK